MNFQGTWNTLIEISNCGSISAAAKRLFVTQPYLSKVPQGRREKNTGSQSLPAEKRNYPDGIRTALSRHEPGSHRARETF